MPANDPGFDISLPETSEKAPRVNRVCRDGGEGTPPEPASSVPGASYPMVADRFYDYEFSLKNKTVSGI